MEGVGYRKLQYVWRHIYFAKPDPKDFKNEGDEDEESDDDCDNANGSGATQQQFAEADSSGDGFIDNSFEAGIGTTSVPAEADIDATFAPAEAGVDATSASEDEAWYRKIKPLIGFVNAIPRKVCGHPSSYSSLGEMPTRFMGGSILAKSIVN